MHFGYKDVNCKSLGFLLIVSDLHIYTEGKRQDPTLAAYIDWEKNNVEPVEVIRDGGN